MMPECDLNFEEKIPIFEENRGVSVDVIETLTSLFCVSWEKECVADKNTPAVINAVKKQRIICELFFEKNASYNLPCQYVDHMRA